MPTRTRTGQIWLTALTVGTILSLFGAVLGIIRYGELQNQRESDRIEFDAGTCQRGNELRVQVRDIAMAGAQLDKDILALFFASPEQIADIEKRLAPAFARHQSLIDEIEMADCQTLIKETSDSLGFSVREFLALADE